MSSGSGVAVEHGGDHEGVVDDLAEAQLLGEVVGAAEERAGRRLAVEERLHAAEQHALAERQLDLVGGQVLLERLQRWRSGCPTGSRPEIGTSARSAGDFTARVGRHEDAAGATE